MVGNGVTARERWRSSPRLQRASKRARGRTGDGESTAMVVGARGGRRWRRRLHRASGVLWLDGELQGEGAELLRESGRRGEAGGGGYGERRRRWCSAERERERGESRGRVREYGGRAWRRSRASRRGGERQAGRRAGGMARWRARAPGTLPSLCRGRRRQRRETGWAACWLGRPATAGLHREEPQVSFSLFIYFCFLISVICFDLNKILNHFITLCQFLQELDILFQSSPTGGIVFGHILIYITNIFPMQIFMH